MRVSWIFALCLLFALPVHAAAVDEVKSPGGFTAWLAQDHSLPLISLRITFKDAGAAYDPAGKEGRARLGTKLLLEGAGERDALAFNKILEDNAIKISAFVDDDFVTVTLETLSEHRDVAFALAGDILSRARFDTDAVERVQSQSITHLARLRQDPEYLLGRALAQAVFGTHPYSRPEDGTEQSVAALTRQDFVDFAHHFLARQNMVISAAGDITPDALSAALDKNLASLPAAYQPDTTVPEAALPTQESTRVVDMDIPQTQVAFALPGLKREDPDYLTAYVLNHIIGGNTMISRLGLEIREKRGLAYGTDMELEPMQKGAIWQGDFSTRSSQVAEAIRVMHSTLAEVAEHGILGKELEAAKRFLTGSFVLNLDTNGETAAMLSTMQIYGLGRDYMDKRNAMINAVTRADVERMAKKLLDLHRLTVVMVGKPEGLNHAH